MGFKFFKQPSGLMGNSSSAMDPQAWQLQQQQLQHQQQQEQARRMTEAKRFAELQDLSTRMQRLQEGLQDLTAKTNVRPSQNHALRDHAPAAAPPAPGSNPPQTAQASQHPGPCPFTASSTDIPISGQSDSQAPPSFPAGLQQHFGNSPAPPHRVEQPVDLNQLLEGASRARSQSESFHGHGYQGSEAGGSAFSPPQISFNQLPTGFGPAQAGTGAAYQFGPGQPHIPGADVPRQTPGFSATPPNFASMQYLSQQAFPGNPMRQGLTGSAMPSQLNNFNPNMQAGVLQSQFQGLPAGSSGQFPGQGPPTSRYPFPNPFNLQQGPHDASFARGFTMQQMPSVMGQMGANASFGQLPFQGSPMMHRQGSGF